ncbi:MAG: type II toxin-antitoxin system PemK/MazF family toxin [Magnetococcales bacterium]|nr:type II toxin-antitoxin system PemK/MazF family toxin [Magnetococcales bacterium]
MICEPSDLVLIPFPFSDLSADKKRPVLVLTGPDRYDDFIGLAVTSTPMQEAALPLSPGSMSYGSLPKPSWVRLDKIYTLDTGSVIRNLGRITPDFFAMVVRKVCYTVGCYPSENY